MADRIKKGLGNKLFAGANEEQVGIPGVNIDSNNPDTTNLSTGQNVDKDVMNISNQNATFGKDQVADNIIASQYLNAEDKKYETYVDKIGMETGIYADIQNIDTQVLETYKILGASDRDIFSRRDISPEEKIAMTNQRRKIATNKITQLRKIQQAKQNEIKTLAEYEANKAEAQQKAYKEALDYMKQVGEAQKLNLDIVKYQLDVEKAQTSAQQKSFESQLDYQEYLLERDKFISSEVKDTALITGDFSGLSVGQKYGKWDVSQTYGTGSVLDSDNVQLASGQIGTPGIDLAGKLGDNVSAFQGGTVVKVTSGMSNIPKEKWSETGGSYGNQVVVRDRTGKLHYYNHLDSVGQFREGQAINKGQVIGTMGNTGTSTGVHLDYRVQSDKGWEDPRAFMTKTEVKKSDVISSLDDYINLRNVTPGGKVINKIQPVNVENIIKDDIGRFELSSDEFKSITNIPGANLSKDTVNTYKFEKFTNQVKDLSSIDFANTLKAKLDTLKTDEQKTGWLQAAVYSGKLNDDYFQPGFFNDGAGYDMLQEYFGGNVEEQIEELKSNMLQKGMQIKDKDGNTVQSEYSGVYAGEGGIYSNFYKNYYMNK